MPADALVHFRVDARAGGDEEARGVDLLGLLLGKGGFAGAAAAGYEGKIRFHAKSTDRQKGWFPVDQCIKVT